MIGLHRLPARLQLTLAFAIAMTALFAAAGAGLYATMSTALLDELDTGLRSRAATIEADLSDSGFRLSAPAPGLLEPTEQFVQIRGRDGAVIDTTPGIAGVSLPSRVLRSIAGPRFFQRKVTGVVGTARILALPATKADQPVILLVGASMSDRTDARHLMTVYLGIGGPVAVLLASVVGWLLSGAALRPVERMRRQASAISASGLDNRLSVPVANDEFRRLAGTLNDMLSRLEASMRTERRFLDNASHELRTPLTVLKAELDLALLRPRASEDLVAALRSASEEADRLSRMADDLLVLSRAQQGRLPVFRTQTSLGALVAASARLFESRARAAGVRIVAVAPEASPLIDEARVRQALDNLLDNAIRFAPRGSAVSLRGEVLGSTARIVVEDDGPGFPAEFQDRAFDPFQRAASQPQGENGSGLEGTGLGLAIVRAVAEGHGGSVTIESRDGGGARVLLVLPGVLAGEATASRVQRGSPRLP